MALPGDFGSAFEETPQAPAPLLPRQAPLTEKPGALPGDFGEVFRKPSVSVDEVDQNLHLTRGVQPDAAAKDKQLGLETGFDPELVGRNRDFARSVAERNSAMSILADAPGTTRFLASDRLNTAIAKDDLGVLAGIEGTLKSGWDRLSTGYDVGTLSTELSRLRYAQNMGDESPNTAARVAELKQKMQMLAGTAPANLFERGAKATGEQTPIQMEIARVASLRALEGGAAGAAIGTWVFPGLGTAGGALAGAGAGVTSGTIEASFMLETGSSYDEFLDAGMGKETAVWASRLYGAAAAAIETISLGPLKRMIPGLSGTTDAAKVPVRQTIKRVVLDYTKNASKVQLAESFEEGLQTVLQDVAQWAGERWEGKDPTFDWAATLGKAREAMIDTMLVPFGPAMGAPKLGVDVAQVRAENRQAEAAAKLGRVFAEQAAAVRVDGDMARMDELRAMAQESKLRQRDPAAFEAVIQHQIDEHPDNSPAEVLISGPVLAQAVEAAGRDAQPLAEALGLEQSALAEAAVTGADVSIPFSKYLAHMVGTPLDATVSKDMRLRRDSMTINERDAWMKESEKDLQSIVNEASEARARNTQLDEDAMRIEQVIGDELAAAANRGTAAVAPQNAKVYSAFFTTMAARGWLDHTHGGSAWNAFRSTWPTVQSVDRRFDGQPAGGGLFSPSSTFTAKEGTRTSFKEGNTVNVTDRYGETSELSYTVKNDGENRYRLSRTVDGKAQTLGDDGLWYDDEKPMPMSVSHEWFLTAEEAQQAAEEDARGFGWKEQSVGVREEAVLHQDHPGLAGVDFNDPAQVAEAQKLWAEMGVESPYFKKWFGDSKVVDAQGKPLVVYHGTNVPNIKAFDGPSWFSAELKLAADYAEAKTRILGGKKKSYKTYLKIMNPLEITKDANKGVSLRELRDMIGVDFPAPKYIDEVVDGEEQSYKTYRLLNMSEVIDAAKNAGHDGFRVKEGGVETYMAFDPTQVKSVFNRGTFDASDPRILMQSAFHGSPYRFDKFTLDRIGSGEGAQAYGWGLYFAGNKEVAEYYRNAVSETRSQDVIYRWLESIGLQPMNSTLHSDLAAEIFAQKGDLEATVRKLDQLAKMYRKDGNPDKADAFSRLSSAVRRGIDEGKTLDVETGQLYEVTIPDDDTMLDWDKPLSEQPEQVKKALAPAIEQVAGYDSPNGPVRRAVEAVVSGTGTGEQLYNRLKFSLGSDRAASEYLKSIGIPGLRYLDGTSRGKGEGSHNYVVFDDAQIAIDKTYYQAGGFFSPTAKFVEAIQVKKPQPAKFWIDQLYKGKDPKPGLRPEELEDLGMREWLEGQQGAVSKEQVLQFIKDGGPKLEEVRKGGAGFDGRSARMQELITRENEGTITEDEVDELDVLEQQVNRGEETEDDTKFGQYQLPGGENYREVLVTVPAEKQQQFFLAYKDGPTFGESYASEAEARAEYENLFSGRPDIEIRAGEGDRATKDTGFRSSHWSEPNILAHYRLNDRTDADGKRVLFIEEIQSDWHQAGRKKGYKVPSKNPARLKEIDARMEELSQKYGWADVSKNEEWQALNEEAQGLYSQNSSGVPNAPFKKSWPMLAFKRVLREAVEKGYDSVAWTTGEQQAERYDLSKQVDKLQYQPSTKTLDAWKGGEIVLAKEVEPADLPDVIGKEAAERLLATKPTSGRKGDKHELSGIDLKFGGEGMKGFYDKMLPKMVQDYVKKLDPSAKVGVTNIGLPQDTQRAFTVEELPDGSFEVRNQQGESEGRYESRADARAEASALNRSERNTGEKDIPVHSLTITPAMREAITQNGQSLYQSQDRQNSAHGMVTFGRGPSGTPVITLFETANESTFLHESGHIFLEFLKATAEADGAPRELTDLWAGVSKEIGHEGGEIGVDAHEKWARALEMYFREGKTPSRRLVHVFQTFASWLRKIYSALTADGYKPSPELSGMFDRLFATDAEIQEVEALHEARKPFFTALDSMAEAERQKYEKLREKAAVSARDKALARYTDAYIQALGGKEAFLAEARKEADGIPVYKALKYIAENGGLALAAVEGLMGEEARAKLVKKTQVGAITKNGALDPDRVAEMHGFKSGEEMLSQVLAAEGKTPYVKRRADEMMKEKKDSVVRGLGEDGVLAAEVDYHNEDRLAVLVAEAEMIRAQSARSQGNEKAQARLLEAAAVREVARQALAGKPVSKAVSYAAFSRAELTAGRNARRAMDAGKMDEAMTWKRQEMLNHALVLEAIEARDRVRKGVAYVKGKVKSKTIEQEARDLITDIAVRFGFNPRPPRTTLAEQVAGYNEYLNETDAEGNKRKEIDFQAWATTNAQKGHGVVLTPLVTDRSNFKEYEDLTLAEFDEVIGAAKQIAHVDLEDRTYKTEAGRIALEQVVGELVSQLEQTFGPKARNQFEATKALNKIKGAFREADASLVKMELLFKAIDGGKMGPWFKYFTDRVNVAAETEDDRMHKAANDLSALMHKHYNARERASMFGKRVHIPELGHSMTKAQLLRVLMDFGNEGNYIRRRDGNGWTDEQMDALKKYADKRDWDFIQETWDYIDTYRPEAFALHKATTGVEPERIMPRPVETPHGTYAGGYFPSVMDKKENNTAKARQQIEDSILYGTPNFAFVQTKQGHLKQRAKNAGGQVLSIEMSDLTDHVFGVIHDITHREAAMNVAKVFRNKTFVAAVEERLGKEYADLLIPWIKDIANTPIEPVTRFEKMFRAVRIGTTVARLGKIAVGLQQAAGLTQTVAQMKGDSWRLAATLGKHMVNPVAFYKDLKFANESSSLMRHRITTATREVTDAYRGLSVKDRYLSQPGKFMLKFLGGVQKLSVDVPTWKASYEAELKRSGDHVQAVKHADQIVRTSQGSGQVKDLTAIQRSKSEMVKSITMFYSFLSSAYAQITNPLRGKKPHFGEFLLTTTMLALIGPSLAEILSGRGPDDDDDDGDWAIWAARNSLQFSLSLVPGVKDVAGSVMSGFGYKMSPVESPIQSAVYLLRHLPQAIEDDEYEKIAKPALDVLGVWAKLPSDQLYITSVAALKLLEDDPSYTYLDLVYKHKKD